MRSRFWLAAVLLAAAILALGLTGPSSAQIVVVDKKLVVTEIRPDKSKIGVTVDNNHGTTANWVKIEQSTRVSINNRVVNHREMWRLMKPGMTIRVHGGRDFDNNIVAKKIWL